MNEDQLRGRFREALAVALERTGNPALAGQIMSQLARDAGVRWVGDPNLIETYGATGTHCGVAINPAGAGALEAFIEGTHPGVTHGVWRSDWPDERRMVFFEATRRGATEVQAQEISLFLNSADDMNRFLEGSHTGVLHGTYTFGEAEGPEQESILSSALAGNWTSGEIQNAERQRRARSTRAQTPVPVSSESPTTGPYTEQEGEMHVWTDDPIVEGYQATADEVRKRQAAQDAVAKAIADAQIANVAGGLGLEAFTRMKEPGATFLSPFYRSEAGEIPLPPYLQALAEGSSIPGFGTIGTRSGDIATIPNDPAKAGQLFNDAIRQMTSQNLKNYPEGGWEDLAGLAVVAGMNPTTAFKEFEKQKPTASRLYGSRFLGSS